MQSLRPVPSNDVRERAERRHRLIGVCALIGTVFLLSIDAFVSTQLAGPAGSHLAFNIILNTTPVVPPLAFSVMGLIVVWRRASNPVGWLMCAVSFVYGLGVVTTDFPNYAYHVLHNDGPLLLIPSVINHVIWGLFMLCLATLLLLFPTGMSLSRRWHRLLAWGFPLAICFLILGTVSSGRLPFSQPGLPTLQNPIALPFVPNFIGGASLAPCPLLLFLSLTSIARRFWLSRGEERQQLKWFTYSAALTVCLFAAAQRGHFSDVVAAGYFLALTMMPVAIGIAMLKYRLWEIDTLINRTLVYGSLSVSLAAIYVGGILGIQTLLGLITGQSSTIAVALSTLVVLAIFRPLRVVHARLAERSLYSRLSPNVVPSRSLP